MMKNPGFVSSLCLVFALLSVPLVSVTVEAQDPQASAIMRGYRTGYSDGYQSGISDRASNAAREFRNKKDYEQGDRAYSAAYGSPEEYRDGYQQGFEVGYNAGFDRKPFDSSIPADLKRRAEDSTVSYPIDQNDKGPVTQPQSQPQSQSQPQALPGGTYTIPRDTIILVELMSNLSTNASQQGDRFQAKVLDPKEYAGAILDGQIMLVKRPGKTKGTAQLQLSFEEIRFPDGRRSKLSAQVIEVIPNGNSEGVGKVDPEGGVQGKDSTKSDMKKVGAAAGIGAVLGAIFGGGTGAAVGATIGAGTGTAGVLAERGKDIHLYTGQQLRIRTAGDAEIQ